MSLGLKSSSPLGRIALEDEEDLGAFLSKVLDQDVTCLTLVLRQMCSFPGGRLVDRQGLKRLCSGRYTAPFYLFVNYCHDTRASLCRQLSPLNLRAALQQIPPLAFPESAHATLPLPDPSVSPVVSQSLVGAASTQEDRDTFSLEPRDLVEDVLDLLTGPGRTLLKEAEELVGGGALAKEEESDFPSSFFPRSSLLIRRVFSNMI